jgi:hypothetical protein
MTTLNLSIYQLYLYLANATLCVPETYRDQIFQDMAYKLLEWDGVPIQELRDVFDKLGMKITEGIIFGDLLSQVLQSTQALEFTNTNVPFRIFGKLYRFFLQKSIDIKRPDIFCTLVANMCHR